MSLLESIKVVLGLESDEKDKLISIMIDDSKRAILDYCNISKYPKELDYVVREMVADTYNKLELEGVSSITRGNTSISYGDIDIASISEKHRAVLHRYKKIRLA